MSTSTAPLTAAQVAKIEDWLLTEPASRLTENQRATARQLFVREFAALNGEVGVFASPLANLTGVDWSGVVAWAERVVSARSMGLMTPMPNRTVIEDLTRIAGCR